MFPWWKYSLFQSWFRRTVAFQKPLAFLSKIINCFTNIFDSKQLKYSPKVHIFALRRENGNSRRNEPLFLVSVDKLPICFQETLVPTSYPGSFHYAPRWRKDPGNSWSRGSQILGAKLKLYLGRGGRGVRLFRLENYNLCVIVSGDKI
jgi:hypothetical protein